MRTLRSLGWAAALALAATAAQAGPADDGRAALAAGDGRRAAPLLSAALESAPGDADLRADYGRALSWSGRYDDAEREFRAVLSSAPAHREALLGLVRLEGYRGDPRAGVAAADRALALRPGDPELVSERARLSRRLRLSRCALDARFTVRCGYEHEDYSFTGPGNGATASFRDRRFHGWDAGFSAAYAHRFALDDLDLGVSASRPAPLYGGWAGFTAGGATRHALLPALRASLEGGRALGAGFSADASIGFRRYDGATVLSFAPSVAWEGAGLALTGSYGLSSTYYDSGLRSGALSSFRFRASWTDACPVVPWVSYAHTREAFEAGSALSARSFSADHYAGGLAAHLPGGLVLDGYGARESRLTGGMSVTRFGFGAAYSWGRK